MEGEGEEVPNGLGGGRASSEVLGDVLEGGGEGGQALALPAEEQRLGGVQEGLGGDEDVVGLVPGVP